MKISPRPPPTNNYIPLSYFMLVLARASASCFLLLLATSCFLLSVPCSLHFAPCFLLLGFLFTFLSLLFPPKPSSPTLPLSHSSSPSLRHPHSPCFSLLRLPFLWSFLTTPRFGDRSYARLVLLHNANPLFYGGEHCPSLERLSAGTLYHPLHIVRRLLSFLAHVRYHRLPFITAESCRGVFGQTARGRGEPLQPEQTTHSIGSCR